MLATWSRHDGGADARARGHREEEPMIRVLLADPEKLMREMLAQELERELDLEIVGEVAHGEEAVRLARRTEPDVLLLRLLQPGLNGVQIVERVRAFSPSVG